MRVNEILTESEQLDEIEVGKTVDKVGTAVGKAAGGTAKAAGAAIGGLAGLGKAFAKGAKAGYNITSLDKDVAKSPDTDSSTSTTATDTDKTSSTTKTDTTKDNSATDVEEPKTVKPGSAYAQAKELLPNIRKRDKMQLLKSLEKELGMQSSTATKTKQSQTAKAGQSGMKVGQGQMQQGYGQQGATNMTRQVKTAQPAQKNPGMNPAYGKTAAPTNMTSTVKKAQTATTARKPQTA